MEIGRVRSCPVGLRSSLASALVPPGREATARVLGTARGVFEFRHGIRWNVEGKEREGGTAKNGNGNELLNLVDIRKSFGDVRVLDGISLSVDQGEVIALIGASGSGKSTLLRSINLLEKPDSGEIFLAGERVEYFPGKSAWRNARSLTEHRCSVGMVFQNFNLWPHKTVVENVMEAPMMVRGLPRAEADRRAMELLENIGLADKRDELPRRLSGGQQQRVAIARALAMEPSLMLFDEVTSALDPELVGEVLDIMTDLAESGMTMIVVSHEMGFARHVSHRTAFLFDGHLEELGPSQQVLTEPESPRTRQFLNRVLHHR